MSKEIKYCRRKFAPTKQTTKQMKTSSKILFSIFFGVPFFGTAQSAPTFQELVDRAIARDAGIEQRQLDSKLNQLDQKKLKDIFLPKVEFSGKAGYGASTLNVISPEIAIPGVVPVFEGTLIPEGKFNNSFTLSGLQTAAKLDASMVLYSGGKVKYLKQALDEKDLANQAFIAQNQEEVISAVSKAYDQFALVHQSKKVLDQSKTRLAINKKTADKALGYGLITNYEHKKIELAQATLDSKLLEYEGKKDLLITQLHLLTGIEKERIALIDPKLEAIEFPSQNISVENRAELIALDHGIKATDYKIKAENTWWIPKVQAMSSLSYMGFHQSSLSSSKEIFPYTGKKLNADLTNLSIFPLFQVGVGFKWEIFDGNEGKSQVEKAKIEKEILLSKKTDAERKLQLNFANNQNNYDIAVSQIALKLKAKQIAENAVAQADKEFRYGLIKSSQLIDAENDLENASLEYETALFNQRRAAVELMKSTQNLDIQKL